MEAYRSYRSLYRALAKEKGAVRNLAKLKHLSAHAFIWLTVVEFVIIAQVYPVKFFIDGLTSSKGLSYLLTIAGLILVIYLAGSLLHNHMDHFRFWAMWLNYLTILGYSHQHQMLLEVQWHSEHSTGEKESVLSKNIRKIDRLTDELIFETVPASLKIVFVSIGMLLIGWPFALISALTAAAYFLAAIRTERNYEPHRKASHIQDKAYNRRGSEQISNWRTIKQFGLERVQSRHYIDMLDNFVLEEHLRFDDWLSDIRAQDAIVSISRALAYAFFALSFVRHTISLGEIVLAAAWLEMIYAELYTFTHFQRYKNEGEEALHELARMLQTQPKVAQAAKPVWPSNLAGGVRFEDVSFCYRAGEKPALRSIDLDAKKHQTIALVGPSGSGKSTLASLLLREYDPTKGRILIDGHELSQLDFDRYRQEFVGVVSQDVQLFDTTIANNIGLGIPKATQSQIISAAKKAHVHDFIVGLPEGYKTVVGEDGIRLSGGQKQRLAIARALLKQPKLLILDEATSALDAISQAEVQKSIDLLIEHRVCTIFVIAHRFSTIEKADMVVVLEAGQIAEVGTHSQLQRHNGLYTRLKELETKGGLD